MKRHPYSDDCPCQACWNTWYAVVEQTLKKRKKDRAKRKK